MGIFYHENATRELKKVYKTNFINADNDLDRNLKTSSFSHKADTFITYTWIFLGEGISSGKIRFQHSKKVFTSKEKFWRAILCKNCSPRSPFLLCFCSSLFTKSVRLNSIMTLSIKFSTLRVTAEPLN